MIFKNLSLGLLLRVLLLLLVVFAAVYSWYHFGLLQVLTAGLILLGQLWELLRYVNRGNQELARFLEAVRNRDFTLQFTEKNTRSDLPQLHRAFNQINQTFKQLEIEKETQFQLLQSMLQIIDTAILAYDENGEVHWVNQAFRQLLHVPHLRNIAALEIRQVTLYQTLQKPELNATQVLKLKVNENPVQVLISARKFKMQQHELTLVALKNIGTTLDQTETEAWQKLLRVMTHEIMNSVAPIASLADTMLKHLHHDKNQYSEKNEVQPNQELLQDTEEVISVIRNRSEGLLKFAQIYRNLSKITHLYSTTVFVEELFERVTTLMKPQLEEKNIKLVTAIEPENLTLQADAHLLEQVLINLILNAARAVTEKPDAFILLSAKQQDNDQALLEVTDNGTGIPEELLDSIFIPFFTSHKDGSGIGLSLAKQIMALHKGSIQVSSQVGQGSTFKLYFKS